jgi:hypothetical protein
MKVPTLIGFLLLAFLMSGSRRSPVLISALALERELPTEIRLTPRPAGPRPRRGRRRLELPPIDQGGL